MRHRIIAGLIAGCTLAAANGPHSSVEAATVSCPGTAITTDREFSLGTSVAATCMGSGSGNINGNGDAINSLIPGYVTIDKSDNTDTYVGIDGELKITGTGTLSGTFSIAPPAGYHNFVLGFKSGQGNLNPDWVAFLLPTGITSGTWEILVGDQTLSHANLYGQLCPNGICGDGNIPQNPVPIPGAFWLMGTMLAGSAGILRWRKRRSGGSNQRR